jgi:Fic family protein
MQKLIDTDINIPSPLLQGIELKKRRLDTLRPLPSDAVQRLLHEIRLRHTYHSDAIEGNRLTLQETQLVLEEGIAVGGKPLKDHIEAKDDAEAFDLMIKFVYNKKPLTQELIEQFHAVVTQGLLERSGCYRNGNVPITRSLSSPPRYEHIVPLMDEYISTVRTLKLHPVKKVAVTHYELTRIHPFWDGNGRVARLVMNFSLMKDHYPPIVIQQQDRHEYYNAMEKADAGEYADFATFIARRINESLQIYLSAFSRPDHLLTLTELARGSPYSQEYLSLRARQGRLDAVKLEDIWYSSKRALKEYQSSIKKTH